MFRLTSGVDGRRNVIGIKKQKSPRRTPGALLDYIPLRIIVPVLVAWFVLRLGEDYDTVPVVDVVGLNIAAVSLDGEA